MANKAIDQFFTISIYKGMINNEKELTMNFVRDINVKKHGLVTHYHLRMVMEKMSS